MRKSSRHEPVLEIEILLKLLGFSLAKSIAKAWILMYVDALQGKNTCKNVNKVA